MKVKVNKDSMTPTQEIMNTKKTITVTDSLGRQITIKKPSALAELRLVDILGDSAKNEVYFMMVAPVIFVVDIDGDKFLPPASKDEVEKLYERLGKEGVMAVMEGYKESFDNNQESLIDSAKKKQA